jgi:hypothetical protein
MYALVRAAHSTLPFVQPRAGQSRQPNPPLPGWWVFRGRVSTPERAHRCGHQLKVWQDLNQDGISQAGELKTLSQWGITSISATGSATGPQAGQVLNGNRVDLSATFTQNGDTCTVGSVDFQVNNFFTQFPAQVVDEAGNPVAITAQAQALPQMNGSGMVRNMQAAARPTKQTLCHGMLGELVIKCHFQSRYRRQQLRKPSGKQEH